MHDLKKSSEEEVPGSDRKLQYKNAQQQTNKAKSGDQAGNKTYRENFEISSRYSRGGGVQADISNMPSATLLHC